MMFHTSHEPSKDIATPCNGICRLEYDYEMCLSCCRTFEEIALWLVLKPAEAVLMTEMVEERREAMWAVWEASERPTLQ